MDLSKHDISNLMSQLGEFGKYQFIQHFLHCLGWFTAGIHMMSFVFVFPIVDHRCYIEEIDGYQVENGNDTFNMAPYMQTYKGSLDSCSKYHNGTLTPCDQGYVYNYSIFPSSRVADWDMVCQKSWMRAALQSIFLVGALTGCLFCGLLADKYGRKPVFCICGILQLIFGVTGVFLNDYYAFALTMFLYGMSSGSGPVVSSIALSMELVGPSVRSFCGTMFTVWLDIGGILVATIAFLYPAPAKFLQFIFAVHSLLLFGHIWLMDESICWLWVTGRKEEAVSILRKALRTNGKELNLNSAAGNHYSVDSNNPEVSPGEKQNPEKATFEIEDMKTNEASIWDLFRFRNLRKRILVMLYCWMSSSLSYFGLSFNSVTLAGNPYLLFITIILAEIPGHLISVFLTSHTGNKLMFFLSLLITGLACVTASFLPAGIFANCLTMLAKVTATVTFNVINSYTSELVPTNLRNTSFGILLMSARLGAVLVPLINLLAIQASFIPIFLSGVIGVIGSLLTLIFLPETMHKPIPQTVEDVERNMDEKAYVTK